MKRFFLLTALLFAPMAGAQEAANLVTVASAPGQVRFVPASETNKNTLILDRRTVRLAAGRNVVEFAGIAGASNNLTLQLSSENPNVKILDQGYFQQSNPTLLARYIGQNLRLKRENEEISGKLLSLNPTLLQTEKGVLLEPTGIWILPDVPNKNPLLAGQRWTIEAPAAGDYGFTLRYASTGFSWSAAYRATLNESGENLDFGAWMNFNTSEFSNFWSGWRDATWAISLGNTTLRSPRPLDLVPGSSTQIVLAERNRLKVVASTVLNVSSSGRFLTDASGALQTALRFQNNTENGLGLPLPPGPFSLWQESADGDPVLRAQGNLPLVKENETIVLPLGDSSGLTFTRSVTSRRLNPETREHTITISLRNERNQAASVQVVEDFPANTVFQSSDPEPTAKDGDGARWNVSITARGGVTIRYNVQTKN